MKNICVITGASSGIGKEFFTLLSNSSEYKFDEIWVIARSADKLEALRNLTGTPVKVLPLDLSGEAAYESYKNALAEEKPRINLLVNCAGYGKFDSTAKVGLVENLNMIDLNVKATVAMNITSLNYMQSGDGIINIASVAAYQPTPYINTYAATKSFVLNFTRALGVEMHPYGVKTMAVCPFWTKTNFFDRAIKSETDPVVKKYVVMYDPAKIAKRALRDYKRGKSVSMYGFVSNLQCFAVKMLPAGAVMNTWISQQKLKGRK